MNILNRYAFSLRVTHVAVHILIIVISVESPLITSYADVTRMKHVWIGDRVCRLGKTNVLRFL